MQFQKLKAVKSSDSQFHIAIASISRNSEEKYEAILAVVDKKKPKSRYEASGIHIVGRNSCPISTGRKRCNYFGYGGDEEII